MPELRTVVITGASRGLGLASAVRLYRDGWRVVAAVRDPDAGLATLRAATGAAEDDTRLLGVQLDLTDRDSIEAAAKTILDAVGAPYALVHNAGISATAMVEETSMALWDKMLATTLLGPVALTTALLPAMRQAGEGRIVLVSSQAAVRGMPSAAAYSCSKAALGQLGESLAAEVAPFGIGVTVLITGTYDTDSITDAGTTDQRDLSGSYARIHATMDRRGRLALRMARSPELFAAGLAKALDSGTPFSRRPVGPDARMLLIVNKVLPSSVMHHVTRLILGIPRKGAMRQGASR